MDREPGRDPAAPPLPSGPADAIAARMLRTWLPPVGTCLLLQGSLLGAGFLIHRCLEPPTPCCDSPLVR